MTDSFWLVTDYFPEILELDSERAAPSIAMLARAPRRAPGRSWCRCPPTAPTASAAATGTGPRRTSIPTVRAGHVVVRAARPARSRRAASSASRAALESGDWDGRVRRSAQPPEHDLGYRLVIAGRSADDRRVAFSSDVATRASEGLARARDAAAVRGRRPFGRARRRTSTTAPRIDDPRVDRRADPAPAGDPALRRAAACSTSASPAATGSRRPAPRSPRLAELHYSKATARPIKMVLAVAGDSPWKTVEDLPARRARAHRVPGAHPALPREARCATPRSRCRTARPRRRSPRSPTRSSRSPRPAARCAPRAS